MQDRAKRTMFYHDLGKDAKINHVLDKGSVVANPFFWEILHLILTSTIQPDSSLRSIFSLGSMITRAVFLGIMHSSSSYVSRHLTQQIKNVSVHCQL